MRNIKEVLRLKFEVGLGLRQIARSGSIGLGTAHEYLQRAAHFASRPRPALFFRGQRLRFAARIQVLAAQSLSHDVPAKA